MQRRIFVSSALCALALLLGLTCSPLVRDSSRDARSAADSRESKRPGAVPESAAAALISRDEARGAPAAAVGPPAPARSSERRSAGEPTVEALAAALDELLEASGKRPLPEVEHLIEELLDRWAGSPRWPEVLLELLERRPTLEQAQGTTLALLMRCWLANAFSAGRYQPELARIFVHRFLALALHAPESERLVAIFCQSLRQDEDALEAPQLRAIPFLGEAIVNALPAGGPARESLLALLSDWSARQGDAARGLLLALLERPEGDLHLCAYRALVRADPQALEGLLPDLQSEPPEIAGAFVTWLAGRADLLPPAGLLSLIEGLPAEQIQALPLARLGQSLVAGARGDSRALCALYRRCQGSPAAAALRKALLSGLGVLPPTAQSTALFHEAARDPELAPLALQNLAHSDPALAAIHLLDLATAPAPEGRMLAIAACGNLLRDAHHPPGDALLDQLAVLLDDSRLPLPTRRNLAAKLAPFRSELVARWRSAHRGEQR